MIPKDIKIKWSCWCSLSSYNIFALLQATVVSRWWDQWILSPDTSLLLTIEPEIFEHSWWLPVLCLSWHCVVYEPIDVASLLAVHLSSLFRLFICLYKPLPFAKILHLLDKRHKWSEEKWARETGGEVSRTSLLLENTWDHQTLSPVGTTVATDGQTPYFHWKEIQYVFMGTSNTFPVTPDLTAMTGWGAGSPK